MDDRSTMLRILKDNGGYLITAIFMFSAAIYAIFSPTEIKYREDRAKIEKVKEEKRATRDGYDYKRFQLDGHTYISFYRMGGGTIVHDPDCPCHD